MIHITRLATILWLGLNSTTPLKNSTATICRALPPFFPVRHHAVGRAGLHVAGLSCSERWAGRAFSRWRDDCARLHLLTAPTGGCARAKHPLGHLTVLNEGALAIHLVQLHPDGFYAAKS